MAGQQGFTIIIIIFCVFLVALAAVFILFVISQKRKRASSQTVIELLKAQNTTKIAQIEKEVEALKKQIKEIIER
jgi:cell division protein FtsL